MEELSENRENGFLTEITSNQFAYDYKKRNRDYGAYILCNLADYFLRTGFAVIPVFKIRSFHRCVCIG